MKDLNSPLAVEVQVVCHKLVKKIPLFADCESDVIKDILYRLTEEIFLPGDHVFRYGEAADKLFIITQGTIGMFDSRNKLVVKLRQGNYLGELGLIMKSERSLTGKCEGYTICQSLSKKSFYEVQTKYPHLNKKFIKSALKTYKFEEKHVSVGSQPETIRINVRGVTHDEQDKKQTSNPLRRQGGGGEDTEDDVSEEATDEEKTRSTRYKKKVAELEEQFAESILAKKLGVADMGGGDNAQHLIQTIRKEVQLQIGELKVWMKEELSTLNKNM